MMLASRWFRAAAVAVAAADTAACELGQKPLVVSCTTEADQIVDVVRLDVRHGHATLLSVSPPRTGSVHASPTEYDVTFEAGPDGTSRLRLRINRYTMRSTREAGAGGEAAAPVSAMPGHCERYRNKPL
jgi:hypothetical protein